MPDQLYYVIIRVRTGKGQGWFELHNSLNRKDVEGRCLPGCMAKAIRYNGSASYCLAVETIQEWRHEMKDRFGAIEVDPG